MNRQRCLLVCLAALVPSVALAQAEREDAIWARTSNVNITLDGQLNESAWAAAESKVIRWAHDAGIPGSGWKIEAGFEPTDPTYATLKFLVRGNQLYLGAVVKDKSIGGSKDFNRFDGLLMSIKDHLSTLAPKPPSEYFYAWWYAESNDPQPPGQSPAFIGRWAEWPPGSVRTPEQIAAWDAVTIVHGTSNTDSTPDTDYTIEMRFDLGVMGYDVTDTDGDIIEWQVSIYDTDWFWPVTGPQFGCTRTWWQSPWGNTAWYNEVKIYAKPSVTVTSGPAPAVGPEYTVENGEAFAAPVIDGVITDPAWAQVDPFDIRYGDEALRQTYGPVGQHRAGQFQPEVNGGQAFVVDPADATVRMFHKNDRLYMAFDFRDLVVQYHPNFDRWDGFLVSLNERDERMVEDHNLQGRRLSCQVAANGTASPQEYLLALVSEGNAQVAFHMNTGTTVDTLGQQADNGFTGELVINLAAFGYPATLGDGSLFIGVNILDGDSFLPIIDSYGNRAWWFREHEGNCCPAWAWMVPSPSGVDDPLVSHVASDVLTFPNPGQNATISYRLSAPADVALEIHDASGRLVERRPAVYQSAGAQALEVSGRDLPSGVYWYRVLLEDPASRANRGHFDGRMVIVR